MTPDFYEKAFLAALGARLQIQNTLETAIEEARYVAIAACKLHGAFIPPPPTLEEADRILAREGGR